MMKYKIYRSFGYADKDIKKHVLVAVEYGEDIYAVTDTLIKLVCEDALGLEQYQQHYTAEAYAPELVGSHRRVKRYSYIMMAVLAPARGEQNDLLEYGITEEYSNDY